MVVEGVPGTTLEAIRGMASYREILSKFHAKQMPMRITWLSGWWIGGFLILSLLFFCS